MSSNKPLQIFKPGRHTAMSGAALAFSESDLQASAAAYDPALFEAPIVVGHPSLDAPAYGWVKSLAFAEGALDAEPCQVDPAFAELVSAGRYKKISAAFFSPTAKNNPVPGVFYLRHVGFLGAQAPAVKGLRTPEFAEAEAEEGVVEFADWDDMTIASLLRSLRDWMIGKFGQDEADKVIPGDQVQHLEQAAQEKFQESVADSPALPSFADPDQPTQETSTVTPEQAAMLEAENTQLKTKLAAANASALASKTAEIRAGNVAFAETLIGEGKLLPAEKSVATATLDFFATQEAPVEFGEGEEKQPLLDGFKAFLSGLPKRIEFAEVATPRRQGDEADTVSFAAPAGHSVDGARMALHRRAVAHQAAHPGADYLTAVKAVS